ncbi:DNA helicase Pif1-like, partial [Cinara cedri]
PRLTFRFYVCAAVTTWNCLVKTSLPYSSSHRFSSHMHGRITIFFFIIFILLLCCRLVPERRSRRDLSFLIILSLVKYSYYIGDGKVAIDETGYVKLPTDFCTIADSQDTLIEQIFPDVHTQYINHEWLAERAILAAKNVDVDNLNLKIQMLLPGNL